MIILRLIFVGFLILVIVLYFINEFTSDDDETKENSANMPSEPQQEDTFTK